MSSLQQIEVAAQGIIEICQKDRAMTADKEKLMKLQAQIFTGIENLVECESCGSITDLIVTMTLDEITAKVCRECGIKALEAGKIQKPTTHRRTTRSKKKPESTKTEAKSTSTPRKSPKKPDATPTLPKAVPTTRREASPAQAPETQTNPAELYAEVEEQTGLKKADIKGLHKIIDGIASPMNLEHTIDYVRREAEIAKLKIEPQILGEAVKFLMDSAAA
jgi:ribosome-binding protein aMBF1 (putative translation factor)